MSLVESRDADLEADCSDYPPSSSASEDVIDLSYTYINLPKIQSAVLALLHGMGEDTSREGLRDTPRRVAKAWADATEGYRQSVRSVVGGAIFHEDFSSGRDNSMVLIQDVEFASTSEHTLLPFFGRCHIAYVPRNGVVLGLSKLARLVKMFSRRLQNQQHLTDQLLEAFNAEVQPLGCAAIVEACHLGTRSVENLATASALGCFYEEPSIYMQEFVMLLGKANAHMNPVNLARQAERLPAQQVDAEEQLSSSSGQQHNSSMAAAITLLLREVGEDPCRQGLSGSAERYVQHLLASTSGSSGHFPREGMAENGMAAEQLGIQGSPAANQFHVTFASQCEHHLLPFHGRVQVMCLPGSSGRQLSQSGAEAVVRNFSRRLQIQERLTHQIADALHRSQGAAGTIVLCQAAHMCMVARGVEKHSSSTVTMAAYGTFESDHALRGQAIQRLRAGLAASDS